MKQRKSISEIQKNLDLLNDERSLFENQNEKYKKELSEQIKKYKNTQLINTPIVEEKYNLWQNLKRSTKTH